MATIKKYNGSSWENAVVRKFTTATEAVENPLYSDGTAITSYTLKGNTVQSGTPTPSAPISVQGVGNKTANLFDYKTAYSAYVQPNGDVTATAAQIYAVQNVYGSGLIGTEVTMSVKVKTCGSTYVSIRAFINGVRVDGNTIARGNTGTLKITVTPETASDYWFITYGSGGTDTYSEFMQNTGSTALPYEPYGYKIPISSNGAALTPMYFSQQLFKIGEYSDNVVSSGTATYNIGWIDLGTLDWETTASGNFHSTTIITDMKMITNNDTGNAVCTEFSEVDALSVANVAYSFSSCLNNQRTPFVNKTGFEGMTATQFKAAMSGVIMYYVKAEATTETVTAPSIPTTEGANTIAVDTTVQPSEFTATWTGWHDAYVKEKSENLIPTNISDWEQGGISSTTGTETVSTVRLRTKDYYPIENDTDYYISVIDTDYCYVNIILYNSSMEYLGQYFTIDMAINGATALAINIPSSTIANVSYYRVVLKKQDESTILVNEISHVKPMLNLGSTAQTYEPYWK